MARRETLRERLNRPGRTAVGRLVRRGIALAPTLGAVGQVLFPGPAAMIATGTGLFRGARQGVRDAIQRRTDEVQAAAANQQAATTNVVNWLTRNLMLLLLPVGIVLLLVMMRGTRSAPRARTRTRTRRAPRTRTRSAPRSAPKTGFARRIKGKLYTDPKAWGRAMKNLRSK